MTFEIPLRPEAQIVSVQLGATIYILRLIWVDNPEAGWLLDISNADGEALLTGVPLVAGADLLEQYPDLGFGGKLFCGSDGDLLTPPRYDNLGVTAHLWWSPDE